jgi:hypothetical protein
MPDQPRSLLLRALESDDLAAIEALIHDHPDLLNAPKRASRSNFGAQCLDRRTAL